MAIMRPAITLSGAMPSASLLMESAASAEVIQEINANIGYTFVGQQNDEFDNAFIRNIVRPAQQQAMEIRRMAASIRMDDSIVPIETIDHLRVVPPCMHLPILLFDPVRTLFEQGRIEGYGYDPELLPTENPYQRLIDNGRVDDIDLIPRDDDGNIPLNFRWVWDSEDPNLTIDEIDAVETTYNTIRHMLEISEYSPTNPDDLIG